MELAAEGDAELGEDLAQVVLDGVGADEQPGADLGVGQAVAGQQRDLGPWAVSSWLNATAAWMVRLRTVPPVASSSRRARWSPER